MLLACQPVGAGTLPSLRDVPEIDESLLEAGLAVEISETCPDIGLRKLKGINFLWSVKRKATDLGYSDSQIRHHIESEQEKARIRELGEERIRQAGFDPHSEKGICAYGAGEIRKGSRIGSFLR
jgi:hypothetical protein